MPIISTKGAGSAQGFGFGAGSNFLISATGGTITECGDFKIHTFTGPGSFVVSKVKASPPTAGTVDYLVIAGGGAGSPGGRGGGGGGGGFRVSNALGIPAPTMSPLSNPTGLTITAQSYPITVGAGAAQTADCTPRGNAGNPSVFSTITSTSGGGGGANATTGGDGGSGGGGGGFPFNQGIGPRPGGAGNTPPVSPSQGNAGGASLTPCPANQWTAGGGGGGASQQGFNPPPSNFNPGSGGPAGIGGDGSFVSPSFAGSNGTTGPSPGVRYFSGGGGATGFINGTASGGAGGGGAGKGPADGVAGTVNTGGGGGAGSTTGPAGGSGIVVIRYKYK